MHNLFSRIVLLVCSVVVLSSYVVAADQTDKIDLSNLNSVSDADLEDIRSEMQTLTKQKIDAAMIRAQIEFLKEIKKMSEKKPEDSFGIKVLKNGTKGVVFVVTKGAEIVASGAVCAVIMLVGARLFFASLPKLPELLSGSIALATATVTGDPNVFCMAPGASAIANAGCSIMQSGWALGGWFGSMIPSI